MKYTYFGDANLDGVVNASDYTLIDNGFNSQTSGPLLTGWFNGDFNYDGVVNGDDYAARSTTPSTLWAASALPALPPAPRR